jgi:hypothetical protein
VRENSPRENREKEGTSWRRGKKVDRGRIEGGSASREIIDSAPTMEL